MNDDIKKKIKFPEDLKKNTLPVFTEFCIPPEFKMEDYLEFIQNRLSFLQNKIIYESFGKEKLRKNPQLLFIFEEITELWDVIRSMKIEIKKKESQRC